MSVPIAYTGVILIWATTPLAVQWSNDSLSPIAAVTYRMALACALALGICLWMKNTALDFRRNWKVYGVASIGLFPNMPLVNTAAQFIPSGMMAIVFGLSPFFVAMMSQWILGERVMTPRRYIAMAVAFAGIGIIYTEHMMFDGRTITGLVLMVASVVIFSLSSVLLKYFDNGLHPLHQISGSLLFALPGLVICLLFLDGGPTLELSQRSALSIIYLALISSLAGFVAFFYLLRALPATLVSLIPLFTPVMAIWLGVSVNDEPVTRTIMLGSIVVLLGLALFLSVEKQEGYHEQE
jgi:drug/metabolite transporter (DMT)-like permease